MVANDKSTHNSFISSYTYFLLVIFCLTPSLAIAYLHLYQDPALVFDDHNFHIFAISVAILLGVFVCFVTWRCYLDSGEVFLRWLTLGFLGFVVVYAPHGFLTIYADENPWLFLLYGPVSRVVMAACFFLAMYHYQTTDHTPIQRTRRSGWWIAIGLFLVIDILVAIWALSSWRSLQSLRISMEYIAIVLYAISISLMIVRRVQNPLMIMYAIAIAWFAQSSLSFTYGLIWNHQWWLAHIIFAGGFLILSYGVVQAYASTRSFAKVYSQAELLGQLREEKARTEQALVDLRLANDQLEKLAATDPLTGAANRREFLQRMEQEMARSIRNENSLSLLLIDLDHFKVINDKYSHQVGDMVLMEFVKLVQTTLRPGDLLGRIGGEEFCILLTDTDLGQANITAERLRHSVEHHVINADGSQIGITISIGVVQYQPAIDTVNNLMHRADVLMYQAKDRGRNHVESEQPVSGK
jgi:diguanylate cyclase (GGDEF)-like protein